MDDRLKRWRDDRLLRGAILLVGLHSSVLGVALLAAPRLVLELSGFPHVGPPFFPSQSGIFLLVLGLVYLRALIEPSFVWAILVSKALAVAFLVVHAALLAAPPVIAAAAVGDLVMLVAVALLLRRHRLRVEGG